MIEVDEAAAEVHQEVGVVLRAAEVVAEVVEEEIRRVVRGAVPKSSL